MAIKMTEPKSECCNAPVEEIIHHDGTISYWCKWCCNPTKVKEEEDEAMFGGCDE